MSVIVIMNPSLTSVQIECSVERPEQYDLHVMFVLISNSDMTVNCHLPLSLSARHCNPGLPRKR